MTDELLPDAFVRRTCQQRIDHREACTLKKKTDESAIANEPTSRTQSARYVKSNGNIPSAIPQTRFSTSTEAVVSCSQESDHLAFVYDDDHAAWYSTFYRIDSSPPIRMPSRSLESRMLAKLLKEEPSIFSLALTRSNLVFCARPWVRRLEGRGRIGGWDMN